MTAEKRRGFQPRRYKFLHLPTFGEEHLPDEIMRNASTLVSTIGEMSHCAIAQCDKRVKICCKWNPFVAPHYVRRATSPQRGGTLTASFTSPSRDKHQFLPPLVRPPGRSVPSTNYTRLPKKICKAKFFGKRNFKRSKLASWDINLL